MTTPKKVSKRGSKVGSVNVTPVLLPAVEPLPSGGLRVGLAEACNPCPGGTDGQLVCIGGTPTMFTPPAAGGPWVLGFIPGNPPRWDYINMGGVGAKKEEPAPDPLAAAPAPEAAP